jgi:hypothetical protein
MVGDEHQRNFYRKFELRNACPLSPQKRTCAAHKPKTAKYHKQTPH